MSEKAEYRCQECGHTFKSKQDYPQCADPNDECGRSRNVEEVTDEPEPEPEPDASDEPEPEPEPESDGDDSGEWTPMFEAETVQKEPAGDMDMSGISGDSDGDSEETEGVEMEPPTPTLEGEDIEPIISSTFSMVATRRGEHWELSDSEADKMADAYARLGQKYLPYLLAEHSVEITAIIVTGTIVLPRLKTDKQLSDDDDEPETVDEPEPEETGDSGFALFDRNGDEQTDEQSGSAALAINNV